MSKNPRNPGWSVRSIAICALLGITVEFLAYRNTAAVKALMPGMAPVVGRM